MRSSRRKGYCKSVFGSGSVAFWSGTFIPYRYLELEHVGVAILHHQGDIKIEIVLGADQLTNLVGHVKLLSYGNLME